METKLQESKKEQVLELLAARDITGPTADALSRLLTQDFISQDIINQNYATDQERQAVLAAFTTATKEGDELLDINRVKFTLASIPLASNFLKNTYSGDKLSLIEDAKVLFLLSSLTLGSWARQGKQIHNELNEFAKKAVSQSNWEGLIKVANEFLTTDTAQEMSHIAEASTRNAFFDPRTNTGKSVEQIMASNQVVQKADNLIKAAADIRKEVLGINQV